MKHYWTLFALTLLSLGFACKNKDCPNKVDLVQPGENPPNYEVIIHPDGFTQAATVRFGQEVAVTRPGDGTDIIAKVPAGLRGNVEISVEENDCVGRRSFIVLDSLPGTYGASLQNIILPSTPTEFPQSITQEWPNAADPEHHFIFLLGDASGSFDPSICYERHTSNPILGFPNRNPVSGFWDTAANKVKIIIDRTLNGGAIEEFNGQFIKPYPGAPVGTKFVIWLTSKTTGRQLVLLRDF